MHGRRRTSSKCSRLRAVSVRMGLGRTSSAKLPHRFSICWMTRGRSAAAIVFWGGVEGPRPYAKASVDVLHWRVRACSKVSLLPSAHRVHHGVVLGPVPCAVGACGVSGGLWCGWTCSQRRRPHHRWPHPSRQGPIICSSTPTHTDHHHHHTHAQATTPTRTTTMTKKVAFLDCKCGVAGDMLLGALLDAVSA